MTAGWRRYQLQPVYVGDLAEMAVRAGIASANVVWDAAGPETLSLGQLVKAIRIAVGSRAVAVPVRSGVTLALSSAMGLLVREVVLTKDEIRGLMAGLLVSKESPRGKVDLRHWLEQNKATLGVRYRSELGRHYRSAGE